MIEQSIVDGYHRSLPPDIRAYLNQRHISDDTIEFAMLGYGEFGKHMWITIPVFDENGSTLYFKLKRPPHAPEDQPKGMTSPAGVEATLYPRPYLTRETEEIMITEGEPDCLALWTHGIPALCSTHGAGTFKQEWLDWFPNKCKIFLCFDIDEAGQAGQKKVQELFEEHRKDVRIGIVDLTRCLRKPWKDVSDFFMHPMLWPNETSMKNCPSSNCISFSTTINATDTVQI